LKEANMSEANSIRAESEPKVTMSAVKLDRDGNVVETIAFDRVEADISPGLLQQLRQAAKEGWEEGKQPRGEAKE